jgi:hypothetical protein
MIEWRSSARFAAAPTFKEPRAVPETYPRYQHPTPEQQCSVENCGKPTEYETLLYDYYDFNDQEFLEQDYTCPFLCTFHMDENEKRAVGLRVPRVE